MLQFIHLNAELFPVAANRLNVYHKADVLHPRQHARKRYLDLIEQMVVGDLVDIVGKTLAQRRERVDKA